jgi:carboxyl-terminal processing protease
MEEKNIKENRKIEIIQPLLLGLMMAIGIFIGYKMNEKSDRFITKIGKNQDIKIGRIEEVLRLIESRYVDPVNDKELTDEAMVAIMEKLDPHSVYLPKSELQGITENMSGKFVGLGIEFQTIRDTPIIITVKKGSPAEKSGLIQLDQIISVNDSTVSGDKSENKIRDLVTSSKGSVKVEFKRSGKNLIKTVTLEEIPIHSANIGYMVNSNTGYIQIQQFTDNTYKEFMSQFEEMYDKQKMRNLIIDLRGNPGGYLPEATKILNQLIQEKDQMLVYTVGRKEGRQEYRTNGKTFFPELDKIAVLVDENSASGSEVIAGAIQDHDRGIIIGRRTFGKGLVQEQYNLGDGAAMRLTTARYYTPAGRSIQKKFTNLEEYETEADKRSKTENTPLPDSTSKPFYTLKLNRKVFDKSGISPDIFIKGNSLETDEKYRYMSFYSSSFLTQQLLNKKIDLKSSPDFKLLSKDFLTYLANNFKSKDIKLEYLKNADEVLRSEYEYLKTNGDANAKAKIQYATDPYITAALEYIGGKVKLK